MCVYIYTLYTPHYALHFTLDTPHSTLYTSHSTLWTLHSTLYTLHFTLRTLHFTLHTTLDTPRPHTLHSTLYTPHSRLYMSHCALYTVHCTLHTTLYNPHSTLSSPHSTLYILHFHLTPSQLYTFHTWLCMEPWPSFIFMLRTYTYLSSSTSALHCVTSSRASKGPFRCRRWTFPSSPITWQWCLNARSTFAGFRSHPLRNCDKVLILQKQRLFANCDEGTRHGKNGFPSHEDVSWVAPQLQSNSTSMDWHIYACYSPASKKTF